MFTRRTMLASGALAMATGAMARLGARAQSNGNTQGGMPDMSGSSSEPGSVHRVPVGEMTCHLLHDGHGRRPLNADFVRNADLADVRALLEEQGLPSEHLDIPYTIPLVETGSGLVLIDTGTGGKMSENARGILPALEEAGFSPGDVTHVVISHFHGDHINGMRDEAGELVFAQAEVICPAAEWRYWSDDERMAEAPEGRRPSFQLVRDVFGPIEDELRLIEDGEEIVPGLVAVHAPGHTPGHMVFRLTSGDAQMLALSDTTNHPALFARRPDWHVQFDMDAEEAQRTRERLFEEVVADSIPVCGYHFPFPAAGALEPEGEGYAFVPRPA